MTANAIEACGLEKRYGQVVALDGLTFAAREGTILALLGPNGAGKSTAVRILTTLARPDAGEARVAGVDVLAHPERARRKIGVVGQKQGFDPVASGRENLILQGSLYGLAGRALRQRADELLGRLGLAEAADRAARTYSGGMQRRLDVALGILHRPEVLFLDEPTTGLDPEARADTWVEIARLAADEQMTILLTTHYLDEADELADEVAIVDRGRIVAAGTPDALKDELRGDTIQVEVADDAPPEELRGALGALPATADVSVDGRLVRARAADGAAVLPAILAALQAAGHEVAKVSLARPSLDEVYLRHAGRGLAEAEAGELVA